MPAPEPAALIPAAGAGTRFGGPKLLVRVGGEPLVRRAVRVALSAGCTPVVVVVGAHAAAVRGALAGCGAEVVSAPRWREGMGVSLAAGAAWLLERGLGKDGVVVLLPDQPLVTAVHVRAVIEAAAARGACMAAADPGDGRLRPPAWFAGGALPGLARLEGDRGARDLLRAEGARVAVVPCPEAAVDVDRPADLEHLPPGPLTPDG